MEALALGLAEVQLAGDDALAKAARSAFVKITATLPERVQRQAIHATQQAYRYERRAPAPAVLALLREACWDEAAVEIGYTDKTGAQTERLIWPLSVVFLDRTLILLAWCCLRQGFRKFFLHQIAEAKRNGDSFRPKRVPLLRDFMEQMRGEGQSKT